MDYSIIFVCLMGIGTVFVGLVCLIVLTMLMGRILGRAQTPAAVPAPVPTVSAAPETNREELVAAISAAIAEELGTDISGIRILSMKKV
jgi:sodium pump decarboxylase gamma subunit